MQFGLCNAPATFQRLMNLVLAGVYWSKCLVYLDDVIIIGRTLRNTSLIWGSFCRSREVLAFGLYLGHKVSKEGESFALASINNTQSPTILGASLLLSENFASIARPLHQLTEKRRVFKWTVDCASAFAALK